ncbi:MAG: hypothetical protein JRC68_08145 [Deltaproteobacteria bacterium]|nr:hypothetical protein [Deltaproteobacteria bacterium]
MGISLRVFLIHDDNSIHRLPLTRFERLIDRDPKERFPQYAGKSIRYALVALELVDRKPIEFLHIEYSYFYFDANGQINAMEQEKERVLGVQMIRPLEPDQPPEKIVNAQYRFARKRFSDRYIWTPNPELEAAILKVAWGKYL